MKAPNKIYLSPKSFEIGEKFNGILTTMAEGDIEYTRTDAFIEKASEWMKLYVLNHDMIDIFEMEDDFKNYMKGE